MTFAIDPVILAMGSEDSRYGSNDFTYGPCKMLAMDPATLGMDLVSLAMESGEFSFGFNCSGYGSGGLCSGTCMDPCEFNYESNDLNYGSGDLGYGIWRVYIWILRLGLWIQRLWLWIW